VLQCGSMFARAIDAYNSICPFYLLLRRDVGIVLWDEPLFFHMSYEQGLVTQAIVAANLDAQRNT